MTPFNSTATILTIDDEAAVRRSIRAYLEDSGYDVLEAANGREGIKIFREAKPDLILCDLRMPEVDGLEVLAAVNNEDPELPIIIVSGTGVLGDAIEAVRLGAWDYILKPIQDMGTLEIAIAKALERAHLRNERHQYQKHLEQEVLRRTAVLEQQTIELRKLNEALADDIRERNKAEAALRESESRFRTVIESLSEGILITNLNPVCSYANSRMAQMCGYEADELVGKTIAMLEPESVNKFFHEKISTRQHFDTGKFETQLLRKDQSDFWVEISLGPYTNNDGVVVGSLAAVRDITDRKNAEREKEQLEAQLRRVQKLETIGTLAGGVAHDFNNILTPILGYSDMAKIHLDATNPARDDIEQVIQAAHRAKDLVKQILAFSRQGEQERRPYQIQVIIKEALKLMRASLPSTIQIQEKIDPKCDAVLCDPTQVHQIVMNLCTNAYHAMRDQGESLEVCLKTVEADSEFPCLHVNLKAGKYLRLTVTDGGVGMDRATIERIFEPFFTTKGAGEGTGLGLSVVHGIVTAHGGGISVYSELNVGTTFQIYFPVTNAHITDDETVERPIVGGDERILFVDDERANAHMGKQMLSRLGYDVTARVSPAEAFELFSANPHDFDLIVTDQTMPQMTGDELASAVHNIRPELPIVLVTGFSETVTAKNFKQRGFAAFLMKPLLLRELATTVRDALDNCTVDF